MRLIKFSDFGHAMADGVALTGHLPCAAGSLTLQLWLRQRQLLLRNSTCMQVPPCMVQVSCCCIACCCLFQRLLRLLSDTSAVAVICMQPSMHD
jgi:hypothetical protein